MSHEFVQFEVEFELDHPYVPTKEHILKILNALEISKIIEDDSEISEAAIFEILK